LTTTEVAAPIVENRPALMAVALSRSFSCTASMARVICPSERPSGPPVSQSRIFWSPRAALSASSGA
jgi:hypothetical protein